MSASIYGGTEVVINGRDLGTTVDDILSVTVAGVKCEVIRSKYLTSQRYE